MNAASGKRVWDSIESTKLNFACVKIKMECMSVLGDIDIDDHVSIEGRPRIHARLILLLDGPRVKHFSKICSEYYNSFEYHTILERPLWFSQQEKNYGNTTLLKM